MRIVVWGINYAPEKIGIAPCNVALCEFLAGKKHEVTMLTSFAYYPGWKKRKEDSSKIFKTEVINGVRVARCWHYVPTNLSTAKRILHELSFVAFSFLRALCLPRPDLWIVVSPPLLTALAARAISRFKGGRYLLHLQDLQPDAAIHLGMIRSAVLIQLLRVAESVGYRGARRISVITSGMAELLAKRGVPGNKLILFPNGTYSSVETGKGAFRREKGIEQQGFLAIYSGNLGVKQGLQHVIESVRYVRDQSFGLVICGEGAEKAKLLELAGGMANIHFSALRETDDYQKMLTDADLMIVSLASNSGNSFFPSKLFSACAAGKPIVAICDPDSELGCLVDQTGCGVVVPFGDSKNLAATFDDLAQNRTRLKSMGCAARQLSEDYRWESLLEKFACDAGIENSAGRSSGVTEVQRKNSPPRRRGREGERGRPG